MKSRFKKVSFVVIPTAVLLVGGIYYRFQNTQSQKPADVNFEAKADGYYSLDEMEEDTPIIVKGIKTGESDPIFHYASDGTITLGYTLSDFKITDIYKTNEDKEIQKGATIQIFENEAYDKESNTNYHMCGYEKMNQNEEYLLFIRHSTSDECYIPMGVVFGKVSLSETNKVSDFFSKNTNEIVQNVLAQAKEKYQ